MFTLSLLKQARTSCGMSQAELARQSGVSLPSIQLIEAGKANPSLETLTKLCGELGLTLRLEPEAPDWDEFCALGLPLNAGRAAHVSGNRQKLERALRSACRFLAANPKLSGNARKGEALQALLLALEQHYPAFFETIQSSKLIRAFIPREPTGRLVRLRRIALAGLAEYL